MSIIINEIPKRSLFRRYWWIGLIIIFLIGLSIGLVLWRGNNKNDIVSENLDGPVVETNDNENNGNGDQNSDTADSSLPSCGSTETFYTVSPVLASDYTSIVPLGNLNPWGGHVLPTDHIYFTIRKPAGTDPNNGNAAPAEVPLYSPGDITITMVNTSTHLSETPQFTDYGVSFSACAEVSGMFGHVSTLTAEIESQLTEPIEACNEYETGGKQYRNCRYEVSILVGAGTVIGTVGGREGQNCLDLWAYDTRQPELAYASASRFTGNQLYVACPVDHYSTALQAEMTPRFGRGGGFPRTVEPVCGEIMLDITGTVQGDWFPSGVSGAIPEDMDLALVFDNVDPTVPIFSVGRSTLSALSVDVNVYTFSPRTSGTVNREFSGVTADGSVYCYELSPYSFWEDRTNKASLTLLLQLTSDTKLEVGKLSGISCGSGPWTMPTNAVVFER